MHANRFERLLVFGQRLQLVKLVRLGQREDSGLRAPQTAQVRPATQLLTQFVRHATHIPPALTVIAKAASAPSSATISKVAI